MKQVDLSSLAKSVADDYINEVHLLQKLHGSPGIIKLVDYELNQHQQRLNIVRAHSIYIILALGIRRDRPEIVPIGETDISRYESNSSTLATNANLCKLHPRARNRPLRLKTSEFSVRARRTEAHRLWNCARDRSRIDEHHSRHPDGDVELYFAGSVDGDGGWEGGSRNSRRTERGNRA